MPSSIAMHSRRMPFLPLKIEDIMDSMTMLSFPPETATPTTSPFLRRTCLRISRITLLSK